MKHLTPSFYQKVTNQLLLASQRMAEAVFSRVVAYYTTTGEEKLLAKRVICEALKISPEEFNKALINPLPGYDPELKPDEVALKLQEEFLVKMLRLVQAYRDRLDIDSQSEFRAQAQLLVSDFMFSCYQNGRTEEMKYWIELTDLQEKLRQKVSQEHDSMFGIALAHGWNPDAESVEECNKLRAEIKKLRKKGGYVNPDNNS